MKTSFKVASFFVILLLVITAITVPLVIVLGKKDDNNSTSTSSPTSSPTLNSVPLGPLTGNEDPAKTGKVTSTPTSSPTPISVPLDPLTGNKDTRKNNKDKDIKRYNLIRNLVEKKDTSVSQKLEDLLEEMDKSPGEAPEMLQAFIIEFQDI